HEFFFPARGSGPSLPAWSYDIATEGFYGFPPLADGRHKVALHRLGTAIVDPAAKPEPTPAERDEVIRFARERLPCLDASRATWRSCQYAMSQDGAFLFAPAPDRPGVFVAGCGSGHAFKFGPLLGEWAADLVEGKPLPRDLRGAAAPGAKRVV